MVKFNAQQLRKLEEERARGVIKEVKRHPIYFILEDIYDTYNIGGLFRLADALAIEKIYLVGETQTPPDNRIKKASIGTYKIVPWEYCKSAAFAISNLKSQILKRQLKSENSGNKKTFEVKGQTGKGLQTTEKIIKIMAVEQHPKSVPYHKADYSFPIVLIFGNESYGVKKETLELVDQIVEIPMWGVNKSLNVIVAAAIVSYHLTTKLTFNT